MKHSALSAAIAVAATITGAAQGASPDRPQAASPSAVRPAPASQSPGAQRPPVDYVIGPDDVLAIVFWHEKDLSAEVSVRPDGKISLPLLNEVEATGLTPEQLREAVLTQARRFIEDPNVTVVVKQINSRRLFITGAVQKPGYYPLTAPMTVIQLIALAGGLTEFADREKIVIMRTEGGRQVGYRFSYKEVVKRINLRQNIELKPGDTIVVP